MAASAELQGRRRLLRLLVGQAHPQEKIPCAIIRVRVNDGLQLDLAGLRRHSSGGHVVPLAVLCLIAQIQQQLPQRHGARRLDANAFHAPRLVGILVFLDLLQNLHGGDLDLHMFRSAIRESLSPRLIGEIPQRGVPFFVAGRAVEKDLRQGARGSESSATRCQMNM